MKKSASFWLGLLATASIGFAPLAASAEENSESSLLEINPEPILSTPTEFPSQFTYDSGITIEYPENGVKGIYVTAYSAGGTDKMKELIHFVNTNGLNAMSLMSKTMLEK